MDFSKEIIKWYMVNKRDLPWRNTRNPYLIWLSEIILQQTRVDQGKPYFERFAKRYPDVHSLADAPEGDILKLWQGLGYYSRARNLHAAAKQIQRQHKGKFPHKYEDIRALKGVGDYTAAAIASFAFNLSYPVLDGNAFRVYSRVFGIKTPIDSSKGKKEFLHLAQDLIDIKQPGQYNQAVMELGALQCVPANPDCDVCALRILCVARNKKLISRLPVRSKSVKTRDRFFNYVVIHTKEGLLFNKRTANDIWKNLYDFPLIESEKLLREEELLQSIAWKKMMKGCIWHIKNSSPVTHHILSHQKLHARFWKVELKKGNTSLKKFISVRSDQIENYAVPRLVERYLLSGNF